MRSDRETSKAFPAFYQPKHPPSALTLLLAQTELIPVPPTISLLCTEERASVSSSVDTSDEGVEPYNQAATAKPADGTNPVSTSRANTPHPVSTSRANTPHLSSHSRASTPAPTSRPRAATPKSALSRSRASTPARSEPYPKSKPKRVSYRAPSGDTSSSQSNLSEGESEVDLEEDQLDDEEVVGLVKKPPGEVNRPKRGGYNLETKLEWDVDEYKRLRVRLPIRCLQ